MALEGFTMPPPYGGLDLVSPIDSMEPNYALELVNIFPGPGSPVSRLGYEETVDLTASQTQINTLYPYNQADGTVELIAVANGTTPRIYKIVSGVATNITGTTAISTTGTNMQCEQFDARLFMCNGIDKMQVYNGSTVADSTFTFTGATPTIADIVNVSSYRERLYFVIKNSLVMYYGNTKSTGGHNLNAYDLAHSMDRGGHLVATGSFTNQQASASQSLFWACSSQGEIVVFTGSSPADTANWAIVAHFYIGKPLGYRAFIKINNDVWILTQEGIVPMSALFTMDPAGALAAVSYKVNPFIAAYAKAMTFSPRWHGVVWPNGRRIYVNVPINETTTRMLVMSFDTNGWCAYELANKSDGITLAVADGVPYYGSANGRVFEAESGYTDNNAPLLFSGRTAFSFYGQRGNYKAFKDIRPLIKTKTGITLSLGLDTDFKKYRTVDTIQTPAGISTPWGSPWGSPWSSSAEYLFNRYAVRGQGHSAAVRFGGSLNTSECQFFGFEIRFDLGGQV